MDKVKLLELIEEYGEQMYYLNTVRGYKDPKYAREVGLELQDIMDKIKQELGIE